MRWTNLTTTVNALTAAALDAVVTIATDLRTCVRRLVPAHVDTTVTSAGRVVLSLSATPHDLMSGRASWGKEIVPTEVRQAVGTATRPDLVGLTGGRQCGDPCDGGKWPDPDGPPEPVHQVAEWAARMCDELAGLAEQGADRSADIHDALDGWDLSAATRAAMTQGVTLRHIAGVLGDMHTRLDEIAHRTQLAGGAR